MIEIGSNLKEALSSIGVLLLAALVLYGIYKLVKGTLD